MQATGNDIEIKANGVTICYDDLGKGGIPVIFIHGFPFDKSSWKPQMDFLKKTNRVIAYDIRGFGKSTTDNEKPNMGLFADDLIKFMDALQINKAIVCGLSMGGYILMNAVNRYPNRFEAIILSDTQCIADSPEAKEKRRKTIEQIEAYGTTEFASTFTEAIFCKETLTNTNKVELVKNIKNIILSTPQETIVETLHALAQRHEMCSCLGKINIPALILCGKEDTVTPVIQSEFLLNKITNSTFHSISNAGHLSNLEQPDEFNEHLNNFISKLEKKKTLLQFNYLAQNVN